METYKKALPHTEIDVITLKKAGKNKTFGKKKKEKSESKKSS